MTYNALHNNCPTFQKGADATYKELETQRFTFRNWIAEEKQIILQLNREISEHLAYIDIYESKLKEIQAEIIRYEVSKEELKKEGEHNENN